MNRIDIGAPFTDEVRRFVEATSWRFASTYAVINRCDEAQTYEARVSAGTLPKR